MLHLSSRIMQPSCMLFVPGRLCLFGEHSDWAGAYRRTHRRSPRVTVSSSVRIKG